MRLIWLLLALFVNRVFADALSDLPEVWKDQLKPIPVQETSKMEPANIDRLAKTRAQLAQALADGTEAKALSQHFGRLAGLYQADRLSAAAATAFANARVLDPSEFRWAYYAANLAFEFGQTELGLDYLQEAMALNPTDQGVLILRKAQANLDLNHLETAQADFNKVIEKPNLRAAALYGLGQIAFLHRDWPEAIKYLSEVVKLDPKAGAAHYSLGQALVRTGDRKAAREHLGLVSNVKPTYVDPLVDELFSLQRGARFQFERGMGAVNNGDIEAAKQAFAAGLQQQPNNARARTSYARILYISGQIEHVEKQLKQAVEVDPNETLARFLLGVLADANGDTKQAEAWYRNVLKIEPDHPGAQSFLGKLLLRSGNYSAAAKAFEIAIAEGNDMAPMYLNAFAAKLAAKRNEANLLAMLETMKQRFPEDSAVDFVLARFLASAQSNTIKNPQKAVELAQNLVKSDPIPAHLEVLALAQAANGNFELAGQITQDTLDWLTEMGAVDQAQRQGKVLQAYQAKTLPSPIWDLSGPLFRPAAPNPDGPMRNYPAAHPY